MDRSLVEIMKHVIDQIVESPLNLSPLYPLFKKTKKEQNAISL